MKRPLKSASYLISIDTGGTFTDCLAVTPKGLKIRRKVLSTSTVRGLIIELIGDRIFRISTDLDLKKDFFKGYQFQLLNSNREGRTIIQYDAQNSLITLEQGIELDRSSSLPIPFEIVSPEEAPLLATRIISNKRLDEDLPPMRMRLSTTKGTNALLERKGSKTLFLVTDGFRDLLYIKNQQRPNLFSLNIRKPNPYYHRVIEVPERIDATGHVLKKLDLDLLKSRLEPVLHEIESVSVCLMNSYKNPVHEEAIGKLLIKMGIQHVSLSSQLSPSVKIVPRAVTADVNSYLSLPMQNYLNQISSVPGNESLQIMNSAGSLVNAAHYTPKDGLFSGPAGGVIGAVSVAKRVDPELTKLITFDMGGTSTDVARFDHRMDYIDKHTVGDATLTAPAIDIETVAAGGGSICGFDGISLTVGPDSAGAEPGPACYGRGGPLTITDVNLLSGRLHPSNFQMNIDPEAANLKLDQLLRQMNTGRSNPLQKEEVLNGFLDIINERMAQAVQKISIQKGFDPKEYTLVAFGGAGAQHAMAVSSKLGIPSVLIPTDAGLLSAYGLQQAKTEEIISEQILQSLDDDRLNLNERILELENKAIHGLVRQGISADAIQISDRTVSLRFLGQDHSIEIPWSTQAELYQTFRREYSRQYGHWIENRKIEIESIKVIATEMSPHEPEKIEERTDLYLSGKPLKNKKYESLLYNNRYIKAELIHSDHLYKGRLINTPAILLYPHSTAVIEPGWNGRVHNDGTIELKCDAVSLQNASTNNQNDQKKPKTTKPEEVELQLFTNRFRSIADQMGEMLRKTALSVNVKERLDYSCALLDPDGFLLVNAQHIPVHLGAMGTCVRSVLKHIESGSSTDPGMDPAHLANTTVEDGDVLITNHPAYGGSHLPDVTVITPVFYKGNRIGFTASRAHHAEIGGKKPGSMPPEATSLAEEGVVIPPMFLAKKGRFQWDKIETLLKNSEWPSRSPDENMADIRAAVSANYKGAVELKKLAEKFTHSELKKQMFKIKNYASLRLKYTLSALKNGTYTAEEKLDDGSILKVTCTVSGDHLKIDFTGTSKTHPGNMNANPSIVKSVIMYVLRLMINEPLPLNDGLLEPVEIIIPDGILNPVFSDNPSECPAVVGGNIETSQRLADTLLKAFQLSGCSYGSMNNVLFGNQRFGYYETIAGGTGAVEGFHGADAVHQHMTNTLATDPEILEYRYPVRLDQYKIRKDSGGSGKWRGGNGIVRKMTFTEPVTLSVLTQHRIIPPYGMMGGGEGLCGRQWVQKKDGATQKLNWLDSVDLELGDSFIIETPGGGGYGGIDL